MLSSRHVQPNSRPRGISTDTAWSEPGLSKTHFESRAQAATMTTIRQTIEPAPGEW